MGIMINLLCATRRKKCAKNDRKYRTKIQKKHYKIYKKRHCAEIGDAGFLGVKTP